MSSENPYQHKHASGILRELGCIECIKRDAWHEGNRKATERFEAGCPRMHLDSIPDNVDRLSDQNGRVFSLEETRRQSELRRPPEAGEIDFDTYNGIRRR